LKFDLNENDYDKMIQMYFNKKSIDMTSVNDRNSFKKFCNMIFREERDDFELPNVSEKKRDDIVEKSKIIC
jgi:hypothetical protein